MPIIEVSGTGIDCTVSSTFRGRFAHAKARGFLRRQPLIRIKVREDGQTLPGIVFRAEARRQDIEQEEILRRKEQEIII